MHEQRVLRLDHRARVDPPCERIREGIHRDELDILQTAARLTHLVLPAAIGGVTAAGTRRIGLGAEVQCGGTVTVAVPGGGIVDGSGVREDNSHFGWDHTLQTLASTQGQFAVCSRCALPAGG